MRKRISILPSPIQVIFKNYSDLQNFFNFPKHFGNELFELKKKLFKIRFVGDFKTFPESCIRWKKMSGVSIVNDFWQFWEGLFVEEGYLFQGCVFHCFVNDYCRSVYFIVASFWYILYLKPSYTKRIFKQGTNWFPGPGRIPIWKKNWLNTRNNTSS